MSDELNVASLIDHRLELDIQYVYAAERALEQAESG